jgi:CubicO group peptidase (beta-lactamase class C family)
MTRSLIVVVAIAIASACRPVSVAPTMASATTTNAQEAAAADRFVDSVATAQQLPGFAATVMQDDRVLWHHGFGYSDVALGTRALPSTQFRVGSVSKLLTAALLMRLSQEGRIDLDAPVGRYVDLPRPLADVTLRQLAGHLGGVRHYRGAEFFSTRHYDRLTDAIEVFAHDSLVAPAGTRYSYSSYGFNLIGAAIERRLGEPFPVAMQRYVLLPLGLTSIVMDPGAGARVKPPSRATLYAVSKGTVSQAPEDDLSGRWPSGGYLASTDDLAKFGESMLGPGLLDAHSLHELFTPQRLASGAATNVGIGWRIGSDSLAGPFYHHGGSSNGGSAFLLVFPRERLVVAMASNAFGQWSEREAMALARIFMSTEARATGGP